MNETPLDLDAYALSDMLRDRHRRGRHDDNEFFAAVPRADVEDPNARPQNLRHVAQRAIALEVAARVVDALEVVDINQQQSQILALPPRAFDFSLEARFEVASIEQACHRVDSCEFRELTELRPQSLPGERRRSARRHDSGCGKVARVKRATINAVGQRNHAERLTTGAYRQ